MNRVVPIRTDTHGRDYRGATSRFQRQNWHSEPSFSVQLLNKYATYFQECSGLEGALNNVRLERKVTYVPTLRGFRAPLSDPEYFDTRTKSDYFVEARTSGSPLDIFSGGTTYKLLTEHLLGDYKSRCLILDFEKFLSKQFFDGVRVQLIPRLSDQLVHVRIGNEKEQPIHQLGDGLQHLITITFAAFLAIDRSKDKEAVLLCEEPELFLHPGFQTRLIESFLEEELSSIQVIATTHSNHFIDTASESDHVAIFQVAKSLPTQQDDEVTPSFTVKQLGKGDRSLLTSLGVRHSSVMLANSIVMVEGITDRLYLEKLLQVFWKARELSPFMIDLHYAFVEYGGSCIVHYEFAGGDLNSSRLFGNYICIADNDSSSWKAERHKQIKEVLGDRYHVLPVREIENLLGPDVLRKTIADYEKVDTEEIPCFSPTAYGSKPLGRFIESTLKKDEFISKRRRNTPYASKSGTLADKVGFCERALRHVSKIDDFDQLAVGVAEAIDSFISKFNRHRRSQC